MPRIELHLEISSISGAEFTEVVDTPPDWDQMCEDERTTWAREALDNHVNNHVGSGWRLLDDDATA